MGINNERVKKGTKTKLIRLKEKRKKKKSSTKKAERKLMVLCNGTFFSTFSSFPQQFILTLLFPTKNFSFNVIHIFPPNKRNQSTGGRNTIFHIGIIINGTKELEKTCIKKTFSLENII